MKTTLQFTTVTTPDFGGFGFYVEAGRSFETADYCEAYNLNVSEVDAESIGATQNAAAQLNPGEWLEVSHETEAEDWE